MALTANPPAPPASPAAMLQGHEPVAYDLQDWPQTNRDSLEWMLAGLEIPFEWDPPGVLTVPESRADEVEGFIDYLDAGAAGDASDGDGEPGTEADHVDSVVTAAITPRTGDDATPEETPGPSTADSGDAVRWLEPHLDELRHAYLALRADHDPSTAFEQALAVILDENTRSRLTSLFAGNQDDIYGAGAGDRARRTMQDAFERLAWTIPEPSEANPRASPDTSRRRPAR